MENQLSKFIKPDNKSISNESGAGSLSQSP